MTVNYIYHIPMLMDIKKLLSIRNITIFAYANVIYSMFLFFIYNILFPYAKIQLFTHIYKSLTFVGLLINLC